LIVYLSQKKVLQRFGVVLTLLTCVATLFFFPKIPFPKEQKIRVLNTYDFIDPGPSYFYDNAWGFELSQPVLYHDLGESIKNARKADILFIGSSRLQLGIREEFILPLAEKADVRVFSLGSGHSEGAAFPLDLIRKHDLKPKVVIVFGGSGVFRGKYSGVAAQTKRMTRWDAIKIWWETAVSWNIRYRLHRFLSKIDVTGRGISSRYVVYRSEFSGWWKPGRERHANYKTSYRKRPGKYEPLLPFATEFKSEMDKRGILMISSVIPYRDTDDQHLPFLKDKLNISYVHPRLQLETADGSHLNLESAERFTNAFWKEFIALPEVRHALGLSIGTE